MNEPCAKITLDVQQSSTATFVAVKRGDIGRKIVISLSDGGFPYKIAEDCYAVLTGTKPDGNILYNHCDIEGNTIVYEITEQTTAAAGRMKAEVKLYGADDSLVTSATFRIIIDGTVYTDDKVESSSEFSALTQLISQVVAIIQNNSGNSGGGISITIVKELPTQDISTNTLYLVKDTDAQSNIYTEYLYVNGEWEIIGSQQMNLSGYLKTVNGVGPDGNGNVDVVGISSVSREEPIGKGTHTTLIQLTNGDTIDISVTDGEDGTDGFNGSDGAAVYLWDSSVGDLGTGRYDTAGVTLPNDKYLKNNDILISNDGNVYLVTNYYLASFEPVFQFSINSGSGGNADYVGVEPADDDLPKVFLTGDEFGNMTTAKNEVKMVLEYVSKTDSFIAPIKIKFQGHSSLSHPKKNFTIKMYADDTYETKLKKNFRDWNHSGNKYVLKANYIDHSHARNIIGANLWSQVVASRSDYNSLPDELRNSPRNGAIDGFPIKVYVNGTYQGIYTWNIGKDDWMWGMDEDNANHVLLCAETNTNNTYAETPCNFRALWSGVDESDWSIEVGTNSDALKTSLNNLIQFVMDNDGDAFKAGIGTYLDVQSAIDYYLHQYVICGTDNLAKNMLLATYDGVKWRCGAYDMDSTFGLNFSGGISYPANSACPETYQEKYSLLWERIEANYVTELKNRYSELRASVYSFSNMCILFERFMDKIGLDLFAEDRVVYSGIPSGDTNNIRQIRNFIRDRLAYVDGEIFALTMPIPCTGISLSANELVFDEKADQTLTATVEPEDTTEAIIWKSSNTNIATVSNGVVSPVGDGSCVITVSCGAYSAECNVSVNYEMVEATDISLSQSELTFTDLTPVQLIATIEPENSTESVVWTSSDISIATVEDGLVTPTGATGDCVITATAGKVSADCAVTVDELLTWSDEANYRLVGDEFLYNATDSQYDRYLSSEISLSPATHCLSVSGYGNTLDVLITDGNGEILYVKGNVASHYFDLLECMGEARVTMATRAPDVLVRIAENRVWSATEFHYSTTTGQFATSRQYSDMADKGGFVSWTYAITSKPISVTPGEEYTIAYTEGDTTKFKEPCAWFYKADGTFIGMSARPNAASVTFTIPDEAAYMYCGINNVANTKDNFDDVVTITKTA